MSGDGNTRYTLRFEDGVTRAALDDQLCDYTLFQFLRDVPNARSMLDEGGRPRGNGYDWHGVGEDVRPFSSRRNDVLIIIEEHGTYGGEEFNALHYWLDGRYAKLEPEIVVTWPAFHLGLLRE